MKIDERLLAYKPISVTLNFDWDKMTYDERVLARHNYIEEQKKKDPNYVGYDFPEWFTSTHGVNKDSSLLHIKTSLISTIGQIITIRNKTILSNFGYKVSKGYHIAKLLVRNESKLVTVHRLVSCTFIPIPENLKGLRERLVINHKNDVKNCNLRSNLEWCTNQENQLKSIETGARKTSWFKMKVLIPGPLYGKVYYFRGRKEVIKHGFSYPSVIEGCNGNKLVGGCEWSKMCKNQSSPEFGMTAKELELLNVEENSRNSTRPLLGIITSEGPCKDETFVIFGPRSLIKNGFNPAHPYTVAKGIKPTHRGCKWTLISREEAVGIPIGLTEAQKEHIFGNKS